MSGIKRKSENLSNAEENIEDQSDDHNNDPMNQENDNIRNQNNEEPNGKKKRKEKKLTSPVWPHFDLKIDDVDNKSKFAHCKYCITKYAITSKSNGSTGNMKKHLLSVHPGKLPTDKEQMQEKFEFSQERYRQSLVKWILMSDQPFSVCTEEYFLEMINSLNPDATTISDETVKRDIMAMFEEKSNEIKSKLSKTSSKLSFTMDAWTSKNVLPFMAIRAHWIDDEWNYQTVLLDFCHIEGKHDGANFSNIFFDCLKRFEISLSKVLAVTMDNVPSNDTFMASLQKHGIKVGIHIASAENRVRCMPHILNLAVQDILKSLNITLNEEEDLYERLDEEDEENLDATAQASGEEEEEEEEKEEEANVESHKTVPKLRKLIKKIRKSTQMRQKLRRMCQICEIKYLVPIIDVATRWNSTYDMIERAEYLKVPLRALCSNEKSLKKLTMHEEECSELISLRDLLGKFKRSTNLMSMERHPTICSYLPTLNWLMVSVEKFAHENSGSLAFAAEMGLEKLRKYEKELQIKTSKLPYVAVFLNPALKMSFFKEHNYSKPTIKEIQKTICEIFEKNYGSDNTKSGDENAEEEPDEFFNFMFKRAKVNKEPKECQKYLNFPLSAIKVNVLEFWRGHKEDFPQLSRMARDYLPVQSGAVAVERDFSMGVDLVTATRCSLQHATIRACMCLKSWFKNLKWNSLQSDLTVETAQ